MIDEKLSRVMLKLWSVHNAFLIQTLQWHCTLHIKPLRSKTRVFIEFFSSCSFCRCFFGARCWALKSQNAIALTCTYLHSYGDDFSCVHHFLHNEPKVLAQNCNFKHCSRMKHNPKRSMASYITSFVEMNCTSLSSTEIMMKVQILAPIF